MSCGDISPRRHRPAMRQLLVVMAAFLLIAAPATAAGFVFAGGGSYREVSTRFSGEVRECEGHVTTTFTIDPTDPTVAIESGQAVQVLPSPLNCFRWEGHPPIWLSGDLLVWQKT